ncbi:MAG: hypothetical protein IT559_05200 [Alphaproteobacteria bacterium]|nr:hypothetical protein [Alphaproteobacteria bacterium]
MLCFSDDEVTKNHRLSLFSDVPGAFDNASGGFSSSEVRETLVKVSAAFVDDLKRLEQESFLFSDDSLSVREGSVQNVEALYRWQSEGAIPGLVAMCLLACERWALTDFALTRPVMVAAILGEIPSKLLYHNNDHLRKVLLQTIRLISAHNRIYAGTDRLLTKKQMAHLLIAACIHDLGHDGAGSAGSPGRLERQSFALARPYLLAAGFSEKTDLEALEIMLLATDVSPLDNPNSLMRQMKAAYTHHFASEKSDADFYLSSDLSILRGRPDLCQMALLLHEADIATSAGLDYGLSQHETDLYCREIGENYATPSFILAFFEKTCEKQFLSEAGQLLYADNMTRIHECVRQDVMAGNKPFTSGLR